MEIQSFRSWRFLESLLVLAAVSVPPCSAETLTVVLEAGEYSVVEEEGQHRVDVPDFGTLQIPGQPALPSKVFSIVIPPDAEVTGVRFAGDQERVEGRFEIVPGGLILPAGFFSDRDEAEARAAYESNRARVYGVDNLYPERVGTHLGGGGYRKYRVVRVRYSPWQIRPKSGRLYLTPRLEVIVDFHRTGELERGVTLDDAVHEGAAREMLFNYEQAREWYPVSRGLGATGYSLVIMCTNATLSSVQQLVSWKESIGLRTLVFTKEWLQANTAYPSEDLQTQIRYYLRDNYLTWGTRFFLIVGDTDVIPMRTCIAHPDGHTYSFTDTYYGELSLPDGSSWDLDGDGHYAEVGEDSVDWMMEVAVGRIPDNDPNTILTIAAKTIGYETSTGSWKRRALQLGAFWNFANQGGGIGPATDAAELMEEMENDWSWSGWTVHSMYEKAGVVSSPYLCNWPLTQTNVVNAWDDGQYGVVNLVGHGNETGIYRRVWDNDADGDGIPDDGEWSDTPFFSRTDVPSLNNNYPSVVYFGGCYCGKYDVPNAVAKEVLHAGAVASIGAGTSVGYVNGWDDEGDGGTSTMQYHWNRFMLEDGLRVGTALMRAKTVYGTYFDSDNSHRQILLTMNLYGDPSLDQTGRPNLDGNWPSGWDYVVVPRAYDNATSSWCPASYFLTGNSYSTYLNYSMENNGSAGVDDPIIRLYVDGEQAWWQQLYSAAAGQRVIWTNLGAVNVKGGRHTLSVSFDPEDLIQESDETDNHWSRQWVWWPYELTKNTPVQRSAPPQMGSGMYPNCDGFQADFEPGDFWLAVGAIPSGSGDDYDVYLYEDFNHSSDGFDSRHVTSGYLSGYSDFVIANRNQLGLMGPFYVGVVNFNGGSSDFIVEQSNSHTPLAAGSVNGPFTIYANDLVDMHEAMLSAGIWRVDLSVSSGSADLGLSIYDQSTTYAAKSSCMAGGLSDSGSGGVGESVTVTVTVPGWYGMAVWKSDSTGLGLANTYALTLRQQIFADGFDLGVLTAWSSWVP